MNSENSTLPSAPVPNDFQFALSWIKAGRRVARQGWMDKGICVFLVPGSTFSVSRAPLLGIFPEGTSIRYHSHIDMVHADDSVSVWAPTSDDLLADDWKVLPESCSDKSQG